jgi:GrpB-like predicted nucleotidyltransferase (UPF0157 family)
MGVGVRSRSDFLTYVGDIVVDVQHVGSTAIAGVPAKPILDIAMAVTARGAIPTVVARLCRQGYIDRGDADGGYLLVKEPEPDIRTAERYSHDRTAYTSGKGAFIRQVLSRDAE